jgi:hypothetical protein
VRIRLVVAAKREKHGMEPATKSRIIPAQC